MSENRLPDFVEHMRQAASDARTFVDGLTKIEFLADKRTQQAVIMCLIIIGEAATKTMDRYPKYVDRHQEVPWRSIRGMRNRYQRVMRIGLERGMSRALWDLLVRRGRNWYVP